MNVPLQRSAPLVCIISLGRPTRTGREKRGLSGHPRGECDAGGGGCTAIEVSRAVAHDRDPWELTGRTAGRRSVRPGSAWMRPCWSTRGDGRASREEGQRGARGRMCRERAQRTGRDECMHVREEDARALDARKVGQRGTTCVRRRGRVDGSGRGKHREVGRSQRRQRAEAAQTSEGGQSEQSAQ